GRRRGGGRAARPRRSCRRRPRGRAAAGSRRSRRLYGPRWGPQDTSCAIVSDVTPEANIFSAWHNDSPGEGVVRPVRGAWRCGGLATKSLPENDLAVRHCVADSLPVADSFLVHPPSVVHSPLFSPE